MDARPKNGRAFFLIDIVLSYVFPIVSQMENFNREQYNFVMNEIGKFLIIIGGIALVTGAVLILIGKTSLGRLPGDIFIRRENFTFAFPLGTCILISVILSFIFWLLSRFRH
jgi:hypothetical protein